MRRGWLYFVSFKAKRENLSSVFSLIDRIFMLDTNKECKDKFKPTWSPNCKNSNQLKQYKKWICNKLTIFQGERKDISKLILELLKI